MGGSATASRVENADISSKPRRRRRDGYFWQLIVLRIPVAFFAVGVIAYLVHYVQKWQGAIRRPEDADDPLVTRKDALGQSGLALSMASVSLAVAVWETVARVVPRYQFGPRPLGPWTIFFDLLVIGLGIPGWLFFAMAEYQTDPSYPTPWRQDQDRAATMIIVFCSKQAAVTPAPTHLAQRQDLEQAGDPEPLPNYKQSTGLEEIEPAAVSADPPSYPEAVRLPRHKDGRPQLA
ncbi:hypothetical protein LA080_005675 [Diaporthe eres]|nr:hypothetical protein LA080_005675 [Diaporthe eres]